MGGKGPGEAHPQQIQVGACRRSLSGYSRNKGT